MPRWVPDWVLQLGHRVASGPWPMYRLVATAMLIGSIQQLRYGPPESLRSATPPWFDPVWLILMLIASLLIIIAIGVMGDTAKSAHIEIGGLASLFGSMIIYIGGYITTTGEPRSWLTTLPYAFAVFCIIRFFELRRRLRDTMLELDHERQRGGQAES